MNNDKLLKQWEQKIKEVISSMKFSKYAIEKTGNKLLSEIYEFGKTKDFDVEYEIKYFEGVFSEEIQVDPSWDVEIRYKSKASETKDVWGKEIRDTVVQRTSFKIDKEDKETVRKRAEQWVQEKIKEAKEKGVRLHNELTEGMARILCKYFVIDFHDVRDSAWYFSAYVIGLTDEGKKYLSDEFKKKWEEYIAQRIEESKKIEADYKNDEVQRYCNEILKRIKEDEKIEEFFKENLTEYRKIKEKLEQGIVKSQFGLAIGRKGMRIKSLSKLFRKKIFIREGENTLSRKEVELLEKIQFYDNRKGIEFNLELLEKFLNDIEDKSILTKETLDKMKEINEKIKKYNL